VIHIATEGPLGRSALKAALALGLPVTSSLHTNFHQYAGAYRLGWLARPVMGYLRRFHNRTAGTFIPTRQQYDALGAQGFCRLRVLGRGVDSSLFSPDRRDASLRAAWGVAAEAPVILHVGRLAAEKNLDLLAQSMRRVIAGHPTARLVIVGDGPARGRLERALPGAVFAGARHGEDLARHYASADAFLFPSLTETYGMVLLEAMASGLDVLAFDYAAGRVLVEHGRNGLLAVEGDRDGFLAQAERLLDDGSTERRQRARQCALGHDWRHIVTRFEEELLAAASAAGSVEVPCT
jgi:glycosyltransferase involved in cell wall biosynthesis